MLPAFDQQGSGDTAVLLLHGIGGGRSIWGDAGSGTTRALAAAGYCALALDFPGYGDSVALGAPDMTRMVDSVAALLAHVRTRRGGEDAAPGRAVEPATDRRVVLVGHSMGGMVAQELLARGVAQVDALVLACTSASFGKADGAWQARFVADRLAPLDAGLGMAGMAARLVPAMVAPGASTAALQTSIDVMSRVPEASYRAALAAIAAFDRRASLGGIHVPVLCLAAEHDRTAPPELMQRMAERVSGAEFSCLPAAGHIANVEQPAAFNAALVSFLQRRLPPSPSLQRS
jgi:3-oxoadipate enol-lactonase